MSNQPIKNNLFGCLPKALFWNFVIGTLALLASIFWGGPKIYIELSSAIAVFCLALLPYIVLTWWSVATLARGRAGGLLVNNGPYQYSRNPMYAAIIFILNPALGILFRSWFLLLAAIPIYFVWRHFVRQEEAGPLCLKFGEAYVAYQKNTARFFPNLRQVNKISFYSAAGIIIFLISFVFLNFSALYLRWVVWETQGKITYDDPVPQKSFFPTDIEQAPITANTAGASYNASPNMIVISRLNVRAPLVEASGTTQQELNSALNQGVIIYPGSALPGQNGEVVLSGHSSVFPWVKTQYGQVFTLLDKLKAGDTVSLVYNHQQYDYLITGQEVLAPNKVKISAASQPLLKLTTCWPIGTSAQRLVVYGELIK